MNQQIKWQFSFCSVKDMANCQIELAASNAFGYGFGAIAVQVAKKS